MLTNNHNLPKTFVKALERDYHKGADYSASQLTKPARMVHLEKRHKGEVVEDVTDRIWSLFGSAVHAVLENGETHNQLVEQYLSEQIVGKTVSGMSDLYEDGIIYDYKVTSVWSYIYMADKVKEWESQLNTYAWLFHKAGFLVEGLKIVMILRDWQASKAKYDPQYPDCQVQVIDVKLWDIDVSEIYIASRVDYYEEYIDCLDDQLPECSEADRWAKPGKWALMKKDRKSAIKLFDSHDDAEEAMIDRENTQSGNFYIEERKGELWKRCEYCSVSAFCNQYHGRDK